MKWIILIFFKNIIKVIIEHAYRKGLEIAEQKPLPKRQNHRKFRWFHYIKTEF